MRNELADKQESDPIVEYYKNWSSDVAPIMISFDISDAYPGKIENEDQKRMAYLRQKYKKLSK